MEERINQSQKGEEEVNDDKSQCFEKNGGSWGIRGLKRLFDEEEKGKG